jgi:hypothetical protein
MPVLRGQVGFQSVGAPPGTDAAGREIFNNSAGTPWYWFTVTIIILVMMLLTNLERSRVGRAWIAIREDEDAAEIMGVPTFRFKIWAFGIGAALGGLSGAVFAGQVGFVNNQKFDVQTSILFLAAVVLGGSGNKYGAVLGGALVSYIPLRFTGIAEYKYLIFGAALVVMMIFRPQGLLGSRSQLLANARSIGETARRLVGAARDALLVAAVAGAVAVALFAISSRDQWHLNLRWVRAGSRPRTAGFPACRSGARARCSRPWTSLSRYRRRRVRRPRGSRSSTRPAR